MPDVSFELNFDYRCPFARNANEHVLAALAAGADFAVTFRGFSLDQPHAPVGGPTVWEDPRKVPEQVAVAAGLVVRERFPERFYEAHLSLFRVRHDEGEDLRDRDVVAGALARAGLDGAAVLAEVDAGWPLELFRSEHEEWVNKYNVFGVPTFLLGGEAVFIRVMTRPNGDGARARRTVEQFLDLLVHHPEINEYKHTTVTQ